MKMFLIIFVSYLFINVSVCHHYAFVIPCVPVICSLVTLVKNDFDLDQTLLLTLARVLSKCIANFD